MADPYMGQIQAFGFNFAPRGWALCEGQLLVIAQHTALFSLLGTTYGGDGRTTFALPNLKGRVPIHKGRGPGLSLYTLGEKVGVETVTLTEAQIPAHNHRVFGSLEAPTSNNPENTLPATPEVPIYQTVGPTSNEFMSTSMLKVTGGGQAHNNLQPYQVLLWCINLTGQYPSRA